MHYLHGVPVIVYAQPRLRGGEPHIIKISKLATTLEEPQLTLTEFVALGCTNRVVSARIVWCAASRLSRRLGLIPRQSDPKLRCQSLPCRMEVPPRGGASELTKERTTDSGRSRSLSSVHLPRGHQGWSSSPSSRSKSVSRGLGRSIGTSS